MEGHLQNSPKQGYPAYREDEDIEKCVLGLGTTLVATIEEVKDRISQIEHIYSAVRSSLLSNWNPKTCRSFSLRARKPGKMHVKKRKMILYFQ